MFKVNSFKEFHPNPMCYREDYTLLNGTWDFCFDYKDEGFKKEYFKKFPIGLNINVPYSYLSKLSGILDLKRCDHVWYHKKINVKDLDKLYILHIDGADHYTSVFINGIICDYDFGAYHTMSFDITPHLVIGDNDITIKCSDDMKVNHPRGKQRFLKKNFMCWYEETTGIYKDVWIERVNKKHIIDFKFIPSFEAKTIEINGITNDSGKLNIYVSYKGKEVIKDSIDVINVFNMTYSLKDEFHAWDVLKPELYDVKFEFEGDVVLSYFGIREIKTEGNKILLNGKELYQKLILDQGYIEDGDLTLTNSELEEDIKETIALGFNGARKHQKREKTIYYSLADMYGLLVWSEMPSMYVLNKTSMVMFECEWNLIVNELYNHPSIICLTPFNESWGVFGIDHYKRKARNFIKYIVEKTKEMDNTRLVQSNDGWSHSCSDIITIHNYSQNGSDLRSAVDLAINNNKIKFLTGRKLSFEDYSNKPIMVSEFGGFSKFSDGKSWGYGDNFTDDNEYINKLSDTFKTLLSDERLCGYCYTQLSDVRQEKNGLLTMDRKKKIDSKVLFDIQNK